MIFTTPNMVGRFKCATEIVDWIQKYHDGCLLNILTQSITIKTAMVGMFDTHASISLRYHREPTLCRGKCATTPVTIMFFVMPSVLALRRDPFAQGQSRVRYGS